MEARYTQDMGYPKIAEGLLVTGGDEVLRAQEHRSSVGAGLLPHDFHQSQGQVVAQRCHRPCQREARVHRHHFFSTVEADLHTPLEQIFPEVKASGIRLSRGMIHTGGHFQLRTGPEPFRQRFVFIQIVRPIGVRGGLSIQPDIRQKRLHMAVPPEFDFIRHNSLHYTIAFRRQHRMVSMPAKDCAERQGQQHCSSCPQPPSGEKQRSQRTGARRRCRSPGYTAPPDEDSAHQKQRPCRQQPRTVCGCSFRSAGHRMPSFTSSCASVISCIMARNPVLVNVFLLGGEKKRLSSSPCAVINVRINLRMICEMVVSCFKDVGFLFGRCLKVACFGIPSVVYCPYEWYTF